MIVRDAEAHIERCIRSALPVISRFTIIDTGCTDRTIEIAREALDGIPGQFLESPWKGHAHNRTELLAIARIGCDYVLQLDADMELVQSGDLLELTMPSYLLDIHDRGLIYPLPLLTRSDLDWYYAGVAHSYLACGTPGQEQAEAERLDCLHLVDHGGGGSRPGKIERDRDLLALEVARNPDDARSWFYLAQSFRDLDEVEPAIKAYRRCAEVSRWDEQTYFALYQAGVLLCEHVSYHEGAPLLLEAFRLRPSRAEALRALAGSTSSVADKIPLPSEDVLFVRESAYKLPAFEPPKLVPRIIPSQPDIHLPRRRLRRKKPTVRDVAAIVITRGDVPDEVDQIVNGLPYGEIIVWDNSKREHDYACFGRFAAIPETTKPVIYWQDDDVLFSEHDRLLAAYEPGRLVTNMDESWIDACGYADDIALVGAGSLVDAHLPALAFDRYLARYPFDEDVLLGGDFVMSLLPFTRVDLGYDTFAHTDAADRLYRQPGTQERKQRMMARVRELLAEQAAAA